MNPLWFLSIFVVFGLAHVVTLVRLKGQKQNSRVYRQLRLSRWILALLLATGVFLGLLVSSAAFPSATGVQAFLLFVAAAVCGPLALLGVAWFRVVGVQELAQSSLSRRKKKKTPRKK
ncbi:hypothetical protein [Alkalilimnicola sp. S0819]|uniref:hypothetical protein n=1 Tax=Alkalilimnicola sp. S0819 TaxID=2613922 RepID=UPI001261C15B|nr:hypothetical protein [Alkalilimnicola sp. S0819]KAB7619435.1 hypothetical protein F3N43_13780 [Alkalilimnicola sp. S0819]MPQ17707.1 hypothetical protein [Alkalilimnicola sp. S0819]